MTIFRVSKHRIYQKCLCCCFIISNCHKNKNKKLALVAYLGFKKRNLATIIKRKMKFHEENLRENPPATHLNLTDLIKKYGTQKTFRTLVEYVGTIRFQNKTELQYAGTVWIKLRSTQYSNYKRTVTYWHPWFRYQVLNVANFCRSLVSFHDWLDPPTTIFFRKFCWLI